MADVEQAPAVEQETVAAAEPAVAAPVDDSYDESLLIKVKGKVKRPQRPDDTERNAQVQKLQEAIDKASSRMKEIKAILDARASGGRVVSPEQQAIRDRLAAFRQDWDRLLLQKRRLQTQQDDHKTERDKLFAEQRSIRDTIRGPSNPQAIEAKLQELEFKLTHETLSPAQEKSLREQKERMERQDRPAAQRLAQVSAKIDECKAASDAIRSEITVLNAQLDKIKAEREAEDGKLQELRAAEQEARSDIPGLNVEKKELWEVIQALRDKQREIRTAFNEKWEEFKKQDKAYKGWFAQERKKRNEQRKKEYEERQAARKAMDQSHKIPKFEQEVYTCEQVLSYLRQFVSAEKAAVSEKKDVEAPAPGMKLLSKKADTEADALFTGMGGKKGKGARKAAEKQQKTADSVKKLPQVLPLETLKTFMALGLEPPKSNDDVPRAIEAVEAKKKEYEEKRDKAAAEPSEEEEELPEEEDAAADNEAENPAEEEPEPAAAMEEAAAEEEAAAAEEEAEAAEADAAEEPAAPADEPAAAAENEAPAESEPADVAEEPVAAEATGDISEEAVVAEANGNAEEPVAEVAADEAETAAPEANGNTGEEDAPAESEAIEKPVAAEGLGVKLHITDDGEVSLKLAV